MTDHAWAAGMAELRLAGLAGWPTDSQGSHARGRVYRDALDDLSDEQWIHAAKEAAKHEVQWFPTPGKLRTYAQAYRSSRLLPAPSAEALEAAEERAREAKRAEVEVGREDARKGVQLVAAALEGAGISAGPLLRRMPRPTAAEGHQVVVTDERRAELARQAAAITREDGA